MTDQQNADADQAAWNATQTPPPDIYDPITPDWIKSNLAPLWKSEVNRLGLNNVKAESPEDGIMCVEFARGCAWHGQVLYKKTHGGRAGAIFEFAYDATGIGEHDIIGCVWRNPDRTLSIAWFEPQPTVTTGGFAEEVCKPMTLTPDEIASATDNCF